MSQHPVDQLIRELIVSGRAAAPHEVAQIVEGMATAPFERRWRPVPEDERGLTYLGRTLGDREESLSYHVVKRVLVERQWADGTTAGGYLADLRRAVRDAAARLTVYRRRGGAIAATVAPTAQVVPPARLGEDWLPNLVVIYAADRGIIVTGYQCSELEKTGIPTEARWLK